MVFPFPRWWLEVCHLEISAHLRTGREAESRSGSVPKHEHSGLASQWETDLIFFFLLHGEGDK